MARPKKGQPGYEKANELWRKTIEEKYGSVEEFAKRLGHKGGTAEHKSPRGFAAMTPEKRAEAGRKGGSHKGKRNHVKKAPVVEAATNITTGQVDIIGPREESGTKPRTIWGQIRDKIKGQN